MDCRIRDLEVYCDVRGDGVPVVMVHGMGVDHRVMTGCMEPVFEARPEAWKRIYFDLPGMGKTPGVDWIRCSDDMVDLILQLVDQLILGERFLIVGESYGGYLAQGIIHQRPGCVAGMLLIGPLVEPDDDKRDVPPSVSFRAPALEDALDKDDDWMFDLFVTDQTESNWARFRDEMLAGFGAGDADFKSRIRQDPIAYALGYDVRGLAEPFYGPSLIVTGRQDGLVGYRDPWSILESYPRCSFAVLDMAGHAMQIDRDRLFGALVDDWLDRLQGFCSGGVGANGKHSP